MLCFTGLQSYKNKCFSVHNLTQKLQLHDTDLSDMVLANPNPRWKLVKTKNQPMR